MLAALGMSVIVFGKKGSDSVPKSRLEKQFFNETTTKIQEHACVNLPLECIHIINLFSFVVGHAGLNGHARLILQS
jgi:hypothetical protein